MTVTLQSAGPFQGRLFVMGRSDYCGAEGRGATSTSLTLPLDPDPPKLAGAGLGPGVNERCGLRLARAFGETNRYVSLVFVGQSLNPVPRGPPPGR